MNTKFSFYSRSRTFLKKYNKTCDVTSLVWKPLISAWVYLCPRGPGWLSDWERLLGAVLLGARDPARWDHAQRQDCGGRWDLGSGGVRFLEFMPLQWDIPQYAEQILSRSSERNVSVADLLLKDLKRNNKLQGMTPTRHFSMRLGRGSMCQGPCLWIWSPLSLTRSDSAPTDNSSTRSRLVTRRIKRREKTFQHAQSTKTDVEYKLLLFLLLLIEKGGLSILVWST